MKAIWIGLMVTATVALWRLFWNTAKEVDRKRKG